MRSVKGIRDQVSFFSNGLALLEPMLLNITKNQDLPPAQQVLVPATVLVCLADALDIDPVVVVQQIQRARADMDSAFHYEWQSMVAYAKGELT